MGWIENDREYEDAIERGWLTSDGKVTEEGQEAMRESARGNDPRDK